MVFMLWPKLSSDFKCLASTRIISGSTLREKQNKSSVYWMHSLLVCSCWCLSINLCVVCVFMVRYRVVFCCEHEAKAAPSGRRACCCQIGADSWRNDDRWRGHVKDTVSENVSAWKFFCIFTETHWDRVAVTLKDDFNFRFPELFSCD